MNEYTYFCTVSIHIPFLYNRKEIILRNKKQRTHKILAYFMTFIMLFSTLPLPVFAQEVDNTDSNNEEYSFSSDYTNEPSEEDTKSEYHPETDEEELPVEDEEYPLYDDQNETNYEPDSEITIDNTYLQELIFVAQGKVYTNYTPESWLLLQTALSQAHDIIQIEAENQAEIDEAAQGLQEALYNLVERAQKLALSEAIDSAQSLEKPETEIVEWETLQALLQDAITVYNNPNVTQLNVDLATEALVYATEAFLNKLSLLEHLSEELITVYLTFEGYNLGHGFYIEPKAVQVPKGSVASLPTIQLLNELGHTATYSGNSTGSADFFLDRISDFNRGYVNLPSYIPIEVDESYAVAGGSLGSFDFTFMSGWMITINHYLINRGAGAWELNDGDVIRWQFSVYGFGADLGISGYHGEGLYVHQDKTELIQTLLNSSPNNEVREQVLSILIYPLATAEDIAYGLSLLRDAPIVDKSILQNLVNVSRAHWGSYTLASYNNFQAAINRGAVLLTNIDATQAQVNAAIDDINTARMDLVRSHFIVTVTPERIHPGTQVTVRFTGDFGAFNPRANTAHTRFSHNIPGLPAVIQSGNGGSTVAQREQQLRVVTFTIPQSTPYGRYYLTNGRIWNSWPHQHIQLPGGNGYVGAANRFPNIRIDVVSLEYESADKTALHAIIAEAVTRIEDDYITVSFTPFSQALMRAREVASISFSTQVQVDQAVEALANAMANLVRADSIDRTALNNILEDAEQRLQATYTTATWNPFNTARNAARTVSNNTRASQEQVDTATNNLVNATNNLITMLASALEELVALLDHADTFSQSDWTILTWEALQYAISHAEAVRAYDYSTLEQVNVAIANVREALRMLAYINAPGDDFWFYVTGNNSHSILENIRVILRNEFQQNAPYDFSVVQRLRVNGTLADGTFQWHAITSVIGNYVQEIDLSGLFAGTIPNFDVNTNPPWVQLRHITWPAGLSMTNGFRNAAALETITIVGNIDAMGIGGANAHLFFYNTPNLHSIYFLGENRPATLNGTVEQWGISNRVVAYVHDYTVGGFDDYAFTSRFYDVRIHVGEGGADITALLALIEEAKELESYDYTDTTWERFTNALSGAIAVSERETSTPLDVNRALVHLETAIYRLVTLNSVTTLVTVPYGTTVGAYRRLRHFAELYAFRIERDSRLSTEERSVYRAWVPLTGHVQFITTSYDAARIVHRVNNLGSHGQTINLNPIPLSEWGTRNAANRDSNIITNLGDNGALHLAQGQRFTLDTFRVWEALSNPILNEGFQPNYHFELIGSSASVERVGEIGRERFEITALSPGLSVLRITANPLVYRNIGGWNIYFDGIETTNALNIPIFVGSQGNFNTGINLRNDFDTVYFDRNREAGQFTFTPAAGSSVRVHAPLHLASFGTGWSTYQANENGSFTINLRDGRSIVEITNQGAVRYHTIHARGIEMTISGASGPNGTFRVGDNVTVWVRGVAEPVEKLSGIYNPGVAAGMAGRDILTRMFLTDGVREGNRSGGAPQWGALNTSFTASLTITHEDREMIARMQSGWMGSQLGAHRNINPNGIGASMNAIAQGPYRFGHILLNLPMYQPAPPEPELPAWEAALEGGLARILYTTPSPQFGVMGGEWAVLAVARSGQTAPESFINNYIHNIGTFLEGLNQQTDPNSTAVGWVLNPNNGRREVRLANAQSTNNARLIVALTSIGIDASRFEFNGYTYDLVARLGNRHNATSQNMWGVNQGINGPIWNLIALHTQGFDNSYTISNRAWVGGTTAANPVTIEETIAWVLGVQLNNGGWNLTHFNAGGASANNPADPDMTAMAIQALAPFYGQRTEVTNAVNRALAELRRIQQPNGGFASNVQSSAQVVVALTSLGIDPTGDEWTTSTGDNPITAMLEFVDSATGGFLQAGSVNAMATEQATYALVAYYRFANGKTPLYNMSDVSRVQPPEEDQEQPGGDTEQPGGDTEQPGDEPETPVYSILLSTVGTHVFASQPVGYNSQTPHTVTVTNSGNQVLRGLNITASGNAFSVNATAIQELTVGSTTTFYVSPNLGLGAGTHTATVTVYGSNIVPQTFTVSFTVVAESGTDTTNLSRVIDEARQRQQAIYTPESWADFANALSHAESVLGNSSASQQEVDTATSNLSNAMDRLNLATVRRATIYVRDIHYHGYNMPRVFFAQTEFVLEYMETAYSLLHRTGLNISSTGHPSIPGQYVSAINGWGEFDDGPMSGWMYTVNGTPPDFSSSLYVLEDGDVVIWGFTRNLQWDGYHQGAITRADLREKIEYAEELVYSNFTQASWNTMQGSLTAARTVYNNQRASQQQIETALTNLRNAVDSLVRLSSVNFSALDSAINNAEGRSQENYTSSSWVTLQSTLSTARQVRNNQNSTQIQVDNATQGLLSAIYALEVVITIVVVPEIEDETATVEIETDTILDLIREAEEIGAQGIVIYVLNNDPNVTTLEANVAILALSALVEAGLNLTIQHNIATIVLDITTLAGIVGSNEDDAIVTIMSQRLDNLYELTEEQQQLVGQNQVTSFKITVNDEIVSSFEGEVTVMIPFIIPEYMYLGDKDLLTVYYLNNDNGATEMPGASYIGYQMVFTTNHFSMFFGTEWINPFYDIDRNSPYLRYVRNLHTNGIVVGTSFSAGEHITRGELLSMLWRLQGEPLNNGGKTFSDVSQYSDYYYAVSWASAVGIVNGFTDGTFAPSQVITNEQMAVILKNFANYNGNADSLIYLANNRSKIEYSSYDVLVEYTIEGYNEGFIEEYEAQVLNVSNFIDKNNISPWALESAIWAYESGLLNGYTVPNGLSTVGEVVSIINMLLNIAL